MHQAVSPQTKPARILFPSRDHCRALKKPTATDMQNIALVDRTLVNNPEQLQTIVAIVNRPPGSVPFIVFGPYVPFFFLLILVTSSC
jgi:helicase MOV-10